MANGFNTDMCHASVRQAAANAALLTVMTDGDAYCDLNRSILKMLHLLAISFSKSTLLREVKSLGFLGQPPASQGNMIRGLNIKKCTC
jgi:hypothetical protein